MGVGLEGRSPSKKSIAPSLYVLFTFSRNLQQIDQNSDSSITFGFLVSGLMGVRIFLNSGL
jgi:hypothetical protein